MNETTQTYPTEQAWAYFQEHLGDIRNCVAEFLPTPQWQSMAGPFGGETTHSLEEFDQAVASRDTRILSSIMNDTWGRAPEDRAVYSIPGFTPMCNLLDATIEGWEDPNDWDDTDDTDSSPVPEGTPTP